MQKQIDEFSLKAEMASHLYRAEEMSKTINHLTKALKTNTQNSYANDHIIDAIRGVAEIYSRQVARDTNTFLSRVIK